MNIAIIGTGNVGGALATQWSKCGHNIYLGVKDAENFKGKDLLKNANTMVCSVMEAVKKAEVILLAVPAPVVIEVAQSLGNSEGKIIIDSLNIFMVRGPAVSNKTADCFLNRWCELIYGGCDRCYLRSHPCNLCFATKKIPRKLLLFEKPADNSKQYRKPIIPLMKIPQIHFPLARRGL